MDNSTPEFESKSKKGRIVLFCVVAIIISCSIIVAIYLIKSPYHKYNDRFVIGNTVDKIIQKYGEFDEVHYYSNHVIKSAAYVVKEKTVGYFGSTWPLYYIIAFDENGIATNAGIEEGNWGY